MFKPTYLYIKTHNTTKLKYFGKTTSIDPYTYLGSGKYWVRHLNIHGKDISTEILGYFTDENECKRMASEFSTKHNITESKEWANLKNETGTDGGDTSKTEKFQEWLPKLSSYGKTCKWWNNGINQTFKPSPPDSSYVRGRLKFNNVGSIKGADIQREKIWVNNEQFEKMVLPTEIPTGFKLGRLKQKAFKGGEGRHSPKGTHWWNNGVQNVMSTVCPGLDWKKGRLINSNRRR